MSRWTWFVAIALSSGCLPDSAGSDPGSTASFYGTYDDGVCTPTGNFCASNGECCSGICTAEDDLCADPCSSNYDCMSGCCLALVGGGGACYASSYCY